MKGIAAGVAVSVLLVVLIGGVAALVALLPDDATRRDRALAAILLVTGLVTLGLGAGGWVAGRAGGARSAASALGVGLLTGVVTVAVVVGAFYAVLGEAVDLHSVGVALGRTEIPSTDVYGLPFPAGPGGRDYDISPPELARQRTLRSIAFVTAWGLLAVAAAALGTLAGASRPHAR